MTGERNGADIRTELFCIQVKKRSKSQPPPKHLLEWLDAICGTGSREGGRIGVVVWQRAHGARDADSLVILRLCDWEALHRELS